MMKIGKNILVVAGTVVGVLVLLSMLLAFAVAKTGIVSVPLFSRWYVGPMPTRVVSGIKTTPDGFLRTLESRMRTEAMKGAPPYELSVSEQELTGALQSAVTTALRTQGWDRADVQIVLRPTDMEVLGRFQRGSLAPQLLARFVPRIADGGLRFEPIFVQLGDYPLPPSLANTVLTTIFSRDFGTWTMSFGDVKLSNIRLSDGSVRFSAGAPSP